MRDREATCAPLPRRATPILSPRRHCLSKAASGSAHQTWPRPRVAHMRAGSALSACVTHLPWRPIRGARRTASCASPDPTVHRGCAQQGRAWVARASSFDAARRRGRRRRRASTPPPRLANTATATAGHLLLCFYPTHSKERASAVAPALPSSLTSRHARRAADFRRGRGRERLSRRARSAPADALTCARLRSAQKYIWGLTRSTDGDNSAADRFT
eukprot:364637-Chlamydomonas_euryale.AAC.22